MFQLSVCLNEKIFELEKDNGFTCVSAYGCFCALILSYSLFKYPDEGTVGNKFGTKIKQSENYH